MDKGEPAFADQVEGAAEHLLRLGRKPGDQVGAERHLGTQCSGVLRNSHRLIAGVAPLHAL